jgi:hypothetical protein
MHSRSPRLSCLDDEIGDLSAPQGSRKWALGLVVELKRELRELEMEAKFVASSLELAEKHEVWKLLGYASYDLWLQKEVNLDPHQAAAIRTAKPGQLLSEIPALRNGPGAPEGNKNACKEKTEAENKPSNRSIVSGGTNIPYTLARLQRDAPELAEMVIKGEISPNAAAIQAGFRKRMLSVPVGDIFATVRAITKHYEPSDLIKVLMDQTGPPSP